MEHEIDLYCTASGKCPFADWMRELRDLQAAAKIKVRLDRVKLGNLGDCKPVGNGVNELRIDFGPGYRVYYGFAGRRLILLLCGGSKRTQDKDIKTAKAYFEEYQSRGK